MPVGVRRWRSAMMAVATTATLLLHFRLIAWRRFGSRHTHKHTDIPYTHVDAHSAAVDPNVETLVNRTVSFALIPLSYLSFFTSLCCCCYSSSSASLSSSMSLFCVICRLPYRLRCANAFIQPATHPHPRSTLTSPWPSPSSSHIFRPSPHRAALGYRKQKIIRI